jgi:multidrug efflux pump subunit AcrB
LKNETSEGRGLALFALKNPHFILVACLMIILLGGLSYLMLPKDLLPSVKMPAVQILSFYPGMPVEHVENNLTRRFELYTGQAIGVQRQESRSLNGVSSVKNYFSEDVDLNTALAQTSALVMSVLRRLPPGTQPPLIMPFDPTASVPIALVAVSGDKAEKSLYDYARYTVRNTVQSTPGAMAPTVMGGSERQVVVYLDRNKLSRYNFSPLEVLDRITKLNTFIPSGSVKIGDIDYQINSNGLAQTIQEMNDFPIRAGNGTDIYLKQIGRAEDSKKIQTNYVLIDGKPEVYVPVYRQPGSNTIQIVDDVKKAMAKLNKENKDIQLKVVSDQSAFVRKAIESISEEAVIGGGMAALLVLLFLGSYRATMAIGLSIPLSFLFAFLGLRATGQTLNAMTLGGLALAVGVLVDNSIVVIENMFHHLEHKMPPREAALRGANEVALPVLISTLSTLIVFTPVLFLQGLVKYLFAALALAVIFAMIASYFIAMTVIPLYSAAFIQQIERPNAFFAAIGHALHRLTKIYGRAVAWGLRRSRWVLLFFVLWLAGAFSLAPRIGSELFPKADAGSFVMEVRLKSGTRPEKTADFAKELEKKIRAWIPPRDLEMVLINVGVYYGYPAAFTPNSSSQDMFLDIELTEKRSHTSQYYAEALRRHMDKEYPGVEYGFQVGGLLSSALNGGLKAPLNIAVIGPKISRSLEIARDLRDKIKNLRGARDVRIEERDDAPEIELDVNRDAAGELGLTTDEVIKNVVSAVSNSSSFSSAIWVDPRNGIDYLLGVQFDEKEFTRLQDLLKIPVTGKGQARTVTLDKLVTLKHVTGLTEANHVNLKSAADLLVNNEGRDIGSLARDIQKLIAREKIPEGYNVSVQGEYAQMTGSLSLVGGGFVLAVILVYLLLVVQFRSWAVPMIIISVVPLGISGIVVMFFLTDTYFSIQAAMGAIFLIGIGVANSVLLLEFILRRLEAGVPFETAIVEGAQARLRPILMTALAAVMGLIPMAVGLGKGSEANVPLGRAVVGGQIVGIPLMLLMVPVLFALFAPKKYREPASPTESL